ncbi:MAG: S9 family peptidase [Anaerolineae bacterium]|nr:S9 family peptidase [Anaerolineae bacterium]
MKNVHIERYLNIRQAYSPAFAPDGKSLAFLSTITGLPQVWSVPLPEDDAHGPCQDVVPWPEQLTFTNDRVSEIAYAPDGKGQRTGSEPPRLLYAEDVGGSERHQLFLLDPEHARSLHLTAGYEEAMHLFGSWSDDGTQICFAANRRDPAIFDLYVQPMDGMEVGAARLVWENDARGYLRLLAFSPSDGGCRRGRIIAARTAGSFDHTLLEIDVASGEARALLATGEPARFSGMRYAPEGDSLYLITDIDSDFLYVAQLDLTKSSGGREGLRPLIQPAWDCGALELSPDGRWLAYTVNVEGGDHVFLLDLKSGQVRSAPQFSDTPGIVPDDKLSFSPDGRYLAFAFSSSTHTTDIVLWDLADTDLRQRDKVRWATRSSHGGLPPSGFVAPELIFYPTFDRIGSEGSTGADAGTNHRFAQRQIPAWFYRPEVASERPIPAVVMVHGGPESQFRPYFHFLIQYLVGNGYAVLAPNVRGSTGYGKAYSHLDDVEKRMDSVADLAHAAQWLKAQVEIDADRVAVYGGSYGGFMVLAALTTYPDLWAAGVDIVGISNLATFLENTSDYRRAHREAEYGSLAWDRDFLEAIAPINHIDQVTAPLMVVHGRNDPRVPLSEAEQLVTALQERDIPVRFLVFDDEGHGIVKLANKLVAYPAIVEFLNEYL